MYKKLIFILFIILFFLGVQFVSANEINQTVEMEETHSFSDFQILVDNSTDGEVNEINVTEDYTFQEGDKPIVINKPVVINGNNHTFDALNKSSIFHIWADNVVINNLNFINAKCSSAPDSFLVIDEYNFIIGYYGVDAISYDDGKFKEFSYPSLYSNLKGGAIYSIGKNVKITDSRFINNYASLGGAIYIDGDNSQLDNLVFINNTAKIGGAVFGQNYLISNSIFDSNHASNTGNSIYGEGNVNIQHCQFINAFAENVVFRGNWRIDNMGSDYYNSFIKINKIDFEYNITHIEDDYYNLKIVFGVHSYWYFNKDKLLPDTYGYSTNKKFCLDVNGQVYNLTTNGSNEASIDLKLHFGFLYIKVFNPITGQSIFKKVQDMIMNEDPNLKNISNPMFGKDTPLYSLKVFKIVAQKNTIAKKPLKIKISLKNPLKNKALKISFKGKTYKINLNKKGVGYFKLSKKLFKTLKKDKKYSYTIAYENFNVVRYITVK